MFGDDPLCNVFPVAWFPRELDRPAVVGDVESPTALSNDDLDPLVGSVAPIRRDSDVLAFDPAVHQLHVHAGASAASGSKSSGQCVIALRTGNGEAWPRPQIDVFSIASSHSSTFSRVMAARPWASCSATWCNARLPIRHGVHFWHDSSAKQPIVSARRRR